MAVFPFNFLGYYSTFISDNVNLHTHNAFTKDKNIIVFYLNYRQFIVI